jgi:hypothetical protein
LFFIFLHPVTLDLTHFVDDSFEDAFHGVRGKRAPVVGGHVVEYLVLAARFVDRHLGRLLDVADLLYDARPLVQQGEDAEIEFVDL